MILTLILLQYFRPSIKKPIKNLDERLLIKNIESDNIIINPYKYIVFQSGYNGFADRVKGIVTTYAISLLIGRNFLIKMDEPCNLTDFLLPNHIDWSKSIEELIQEGKLRRNYTSLKYLKRNKGNLKAYNVTGILNMAYRYWDVDVIFFTINDNWLPFVQGNKYLKQRIFQIGYQSKDFKMSYLLKDWLNRLFKFSPRLQKEYDKYLKLLKPNKDTYVICAQIRTHDIDNKKNSSIAHLFWNYINVNFFDKKNKNNDNYRIFITSDYDLIEKEASIYFGYDKVVYTTNVGKSNHFLKIKDCKNEIKGVLDFFLLQHCDLALHGHGEYGKTAYYNRVYPKSMDMIKINDTAASDFYVNMVTSL